jgi:hypothetical protein
MTNIAYNVAMRLDFDIIFGRTCTSQGKLLNICNEPQAREATPQQKHLAQLPERDEVQVPMNESDLERPACHTSIGKRTANTAFCKHANYAVSSSLWLVYLPTRNLEDVRINSHQRCCILRSWNYTSQLKIIIQNGV